MQSITVRNCNNIDEGTIEILQNRLNIKYAVNGTGKTTITKALYLNCHEKQSLDCLRPFKYKLDNDEQHDPSINSDINSVAVFDEGYVSSFLFTEDELIKNCFEIFVKDSNYDNNMEGIKKLVSHVQEFMNDERASKIFSDINGLRDIIELNKDGSLSKKCKIMKGLEGGNLIDNIPSELMPYQSYLKSNNSIGWISWQIQGNDNYNDISDSCPFCTSDKQSKMAAIKNVKNVYNSKKVEHLLTVKRVFESVGPYLLTDDYDRIMKIVSNCDNLNEDDKLFITSIYKEYEMIYSKLFLTFNISYNSLKDISELDKYLKEIHISLESLHHFKSDTFCSYLNDYNNEIDKLSKDVDKLKQNVYRQNAMLKVTAEKHKDEINSFMKHAGFNYTVDIQVDDKDSRILIKHKDYQKDLINVTDVLSYGEKNALSLVLFAYDAIRSNPDLIILDDPISSFDCNKKYAIMNMFFMDKKAIFKNKTVLLLTHDISSMIDFIKTNIQPKPKFYFLENNHNVLTEKEIDTGKDIQPYTSICLSNANTVDNIISRITYLRQYYEMVNKGPVWNYLSSLLHGREKPTSSKTGKEMSSSDVKSAEEEIRKTIPDFDYDSILHNVMDVDYLIDAYRQTKSNYSKLHIFRLIDMGDIPRTLDNYIKESYHVGGQHIYQLNPESFPVVPQYIIDQCDEQIEEFCKIGNNHEF